MRDDFEHVAGVPFENWEDGAVGARAIGADEIWGCFVSEKARTMEEIEVLTKHVWEAVRHDAHIRLRIVAPGLFQSFGSLADNFVGGRGYVEAGRADDYIYFGLVARTVNDSVCCELDCGVCDHLHVFSPQRGEVIRSRRHTTAT